MGDNMEGTKEKISYKELRERAEGRYYLVSSNTRAGWFEIGSLGNSTGSSERREYLFEVELTSDPAQESSDVLNLQYFFVRTEQALRTKRDKGENTVFILLVKVQNQRDFYRVSSYLYLQSQLRQDMLFYIRFKSSVHGLQDLRGIGRLPPLICVAKGRENTSYFSYYQLAWEEKLNPEDIAHCIGAVKEYLGASKIDENTDAEDGDGADECENRLTRLEHLRDSGKFSLFKLICANYLVEMLLKIKGITRRGLSFEEKCRQVEKVCEYIVEHCASLTPLGQLIWFIYLYYMQEKKEIVEFDQIEAKDKGYVLRRDRLDNSYMNAVEYADGVLQLLENSCQHTVNGIGYLSIRVHYIDRSCPESDLEHVAFNRSRLIKRYSHIEKAGDASYTVFPRRLTLEKDIPYYFELRVTDDATDYSSGSVSARGIPEMHARNREIEGKVELYQVFGRRLSSDERNKNKLSEKNLENITCHYGVRQLQKIVLRNQGCFLVSTPSMELGYTEIYSAYFEKNLPKLPKGQTWDERKLMPELTQRRGEGWQELKVRHLQACRSTEYQILLPIGSRRKNPARVETPSINPAKHPIDLRALKDGRLYSVSRIFDLSCELDDIFANNPFFTFREGDFNSSKIDLTKSLESTLNKAFNETGRDSSTTVYLLNFSGLQGSKLELAAKALFLHIGRKALAQESAEEKRLLFAAYFEGLIQMQEFILDYSVFYDENGQNPYMDGVQIAVCSREGNRPPEVNFLLAGTKLAAAWKTADTFAYYNNSNHTLALLPQLRYLSDDWFWGEKAEDADPIAPFPFDLYLNEVPGLKTEDRENRNQTDVLPAPANDCWFMRQIAEMIGRDLRKKELGCKIENVHVRLGSKMHVEDFYEAELLFQNISMVTRFAYLIVRGILDENPDQENQLLILGYETYSTILLEYVVNFLEECGINAYYAVYGHDSLERAGFIIPAALRAAALRPEKDMRLVTVYPIGTTLSTVYHMIDSVPNDYRAKPWKNFCVLVVESKNENMSPRVNYWTMREKQQGQTAHTAEDRSTLTLTTDKDGRAETKVRFYLEARALWHEPDQCIDNSLVEERVLTYVDPTSTVPNMIFPLTTRKNDGPESFLKAMGTGAETENIKRLEKLRGCVSYGHIHVGNNHFLYHLDLPLYFEKVRKMDMQAELQKWAGSVDAEAFNIIVAPLEQGNTAFVQTIADKVFAHSIRIIRIPFLDARKEDIRAKYSFISEEYQRIKNTNPDVKINLYYVTLSFVTGETFLRATKLVGMLLDDSNCYQKAGFLFSGIFTLINRSSRSTIQTMVENPDRDFHAYLHLSVPHYNTYKGSCPGCFWHQQNRMLSESCATNDAYSSLVRAVEKLKLRTPEEHRVWLVDGLWNSPKGFSALCMWLYRLHIQKSDEKNDWIIWLRDECLRQVEKGAGSGAIRLRELRKKLDDDNFGRLERLWAEEIMQDRAYMRLVCTHKSYCLLEDDKRFRRETTALEEEASACILELLLEEAALQPTEYVELVISYVKVLSREYLSKYHYIRQSIFRIMAGMLHLLLNRPERGLSQMDSKTVSGLGLVIKRCKKATPLQRYQLTITILCQLADMQANMVIHGDVLRELSQQFEALRKEQERLVEKDRYAGLCPLPSPETAEKDYIRCVKRCLLLGDEENKSLLLQNVENGQTIWEGRIG